MRIEFVPMPRLILMVLLAGVVAGCGSAAPTASPTGGSRAPGLDGMTAELWAEDLAQVDQTVRTKHVNPFAVHSEAEWEARLAAVSAEIGSGTPNEEMVRVASLMGLMDTHSSLASMPGDGWDFYGLLPYRFSDGWFVIRADDPSLVGARLVGIGGVPIDEVVERLTPLVPHDNANGLLMGLLWELNSIEYLNGAGIVADPAHPSFELLAADGTTTVIDPPVSGEATYDLVNPGWLSGGAPEAVARRGELIWTRVDEARRVFLVSVNDYGDMTSAIEAMTAALDASTVDRVVFDMRYLPGGNGDIKILETLVGDPRISGPGGLIVLTGRENVSVATQVVYYLDTDTDALLVGEATPARANNFTCPCEDVTLPNSGLVISVPLYWDIRDGDDRSEIAPDVPMALSSVDFFAGRDSVLEAAISGR